jgi:predicted RNA-binding protein with TRAM domain
MVDIPDQLRCLFAANIEHDSDSYLIEIPKEEIEHGEVSLGETYRIGLVPQPIKNDRDKTSRKTRSEKETPNEPRTPPVEEGETRKVTIEGVGDRGDGIAKVERGFVLIVPETTPNDEVVVEIERVRENVAFARVIEEHTKSSSTASPSESENDPLDGLSAQPPPLDNEDGP